MAVKRPARAPLQIFIGEAVPRCPEKMPKASASHSGRTFSHLHHVRPPQHARRADHMDRNSGDEGQLLYVALCRDKLAEHQAQMIKEQEKQDKILKRASLIAQATRALQTPPPDQDAGTPAPIESFVEMPSLAATTCDGSSAAADTAPEAAGDADLKNLEAFLTHRGMAGSIPGRRRVGTEGEGIDGKSGVASSSGGRGQRQPDVHVSAVRAVGGASDEYLEMKRLGKLYTQWRDQQEDSDDDMEAPRAMTERTAARRGTQGMGGAIRRATAGHPANKEGKEGPVGGGGSRAPSPPSQGSGSRGTGRGTPSSDVQSKQSGKEEGAGGYEDIRDKSEQKFREYQKSMTEKIFSAVTVDEQSVGSGKPVKQIEGFPTLNLMRLYQGPWRLNH
eukprot:gnl/MRDRNA2_/MRDRNA2_51423_c0_seq1.p1 gnl/MRDRNA2_/MRDRNA2_51423_c0~~gnl/MRDRNA2_/MRDRNA2_51423_c0_seq1.p1  ORF type:complete len:424 (-),score=86.34 gnl/MRDRNA2_/MRDRNA2_51423_c0_seq1:33-1202(-)